MLTPTLAEFLKLTRDGKQIPLRRRIAADLETPVSVFLKLKPHGAAFLLESVERGIQMGRYSFIGVSPYAVARLADGTVAIEKNGQASSSPVDAADPFSFIRAELANSRALLGDDLPGPFASAVGYISYDIVRHFERVPAPRTDGLGLPDYHFLFPRTLVVFDHVKSELEILTLPPEGQPDAAYAAAKDQVESLLAAMQARLPTIPDAKPAQRSSAPTSNMTPDAFQIVLSQRLRGETPAPPFQIYRALRILNPSPYMFFIDFGNYQLIGSSPEVLVKLDKNQATLCPIAGTRPRGNTAAEDQELEEELLSNEKERAEHVMLVDLGRNDLGRACRIGSVVTESLMQVERYSHVMHLVSRITGELRSEYDMFDLLRAAFPAGTVTGAPKIRAMEIINDLEEEKRGPYAGAVGFLGRQSDMDMCITIRTLIMRGQEYFVQAGAGIVADSDPAFEYQETLDKIAALAKAVAVAEEGF